MRFQTNYAISSLVKDNVLGILHRGRYLKNRRLRGVTLDRLEPIISRPKSNNSLFGSTSDDGKFG